MTAFSDVHAKYIYIPIQIEAQWGASLSIQTFIHDSSVLVLSVPEESDFSKCQVTIVPTHTFCEMYMFIMCGLT